jgi:hypothetical protein
VPAKPAFDERRLKYRGIISLAYRVSFQLEKTLKTKKQKMSATTWTVFWRNLGIKTVNRPRAIKNNNPKKDFASLQRIGVDRNIAENIYQRSNAYGDELFFSKFSRFFRKDPQTIKLWIKGKSITDAFRKCEPDSSFGWALRL